MAKRSPNYPGVDLKFAVERAERLWKSQQAHPAASEVIMGNLGYSARSGAGSVTYGALKRFGLLEDIESRRAKLSNLGIEIVKGETTGQRDFGKLREAALYPKLHQEIWEQYGAALPSDSVIEFDLQQKGFTSGGAADFLGEWKRTMAFAKLTDSSASVTDDDSGEGSEDGPEEAPEMTPATATPTPATPTLPPAQGRHFPIPLISGDDAALTVPSAMTDEAWDQMLAVIAAMKPGIVRPPKTSSSESERPS
jgi:hypothetical protein